MKFTTVEEPVRRQQRLQSDCAAKAARRLTARQDCDDLIERWSSVAAQLPDAVELPQQRDVRLQVLLQHYQRLQQLLQPGGTDDKHWLLSNVQSSPLMTVGQQATVTVLPRSDAVSLTGPSGCCVAQAVTMRYVVTRLFKFQPRAGGQGSHSWTSAESRGHGVFALSITCHSRLQVVLLLPVLSPMLCTVNCSVTLAWMLCRAHVSVPLTTALLMRFCCRVSAFLMRTLLKTGITIAALISVAGVGRAVQFADVLLLWLFC